MRAARARVDPGLDRHPDALQHPARLPDDAAHDDYGGLDEYIDETRSPTGWWGKLDTYIVSLLKAWWGAARRGERLLLRLPAADRRRQLELLDRAADARRARSRATSIAGENPPSARRTARRTGSRSRSSTGSSCATSSRSRRRVLVRQPGDRVGRAEDRGDPDRGLLPARAVARREGRLVHEHAALLQWHYKAVEPKEDCRSELWFYYHLGPQAPREAAGLAGPKNRRCST
jgi:formate dehydrogenase major subunit